MRCAAALHSLPCERYGAASADAARLASSARQHRACGRTSRTLAAAAATASSTGSYSSTPNSLGLGLVLGGLRSRHRDRLLSRFLSRLLRRLLARGRSRSAAACSPSLSRSLLSFTASLSASFAGLPKRLTQLMRHRRSRSPPAQPSSPPRQAAQAQLLASRRRAAAARRAPARAVALALPTRLHKRLLCSCAPPQPFAACAALVSAAAHSAGAAPGTPQAHGGSAQSPRAPQHSSNSADLT
jgi:hypothetical protein